MVDMVCVVLWVLLVGQLVACGLVFFCFDYDYDVYSGSS